MDINVLSVLYVADIFFPSGYCSLGTLVYGNIIYLFPMSFQLDDWKTLKVSYILKFISSTPQAKFVVQLQIGKNIQQIEWITVQKSKVLSTQPHTIQYFILWAVSPLGFLLSNTLSIIHNFTLLPSERTY